MKCLPLSILTPPSTPPTRRCSTPPTASGLKRGIYKGASLGSAAEVAYARSYEGPVPGPGDRPFISPGVAWARPVVVEVHGAWLLYIRQFKPGLFGGGGGRLGGWKEGHCFCRLLSRFQNQLESASRPGVTPVGETGISMTRFRNLYCT